MTLHQGEAFAIIALMLGLFMSDRVRYDMVGGIALIAAVATGIVPSDRAFDGFANPVIVIIAAVLVLGRAIAISGVIDLAIRRLLRTFEGTSAQVGILSACVAVLSAGMKNVGTLGIFMPIAIQTAVRSNRPPSLYLMPLAFSSLVGGTITLIGTSPNLLISTVREDLEGRPFGLFDFASVGLPLTVLTVLFLSAGWRLIPQGRTGQASAERQFEIETYTSEVTIPPSSRSIGRTVEELEAMGDGAIEVTSIIREGNRRYIPSGHWQLYAGDVLVIQADPVALKTVIDEGELVLHGAGAIAATRSKDDTIENVEAVITVDSPMIGQTLTSMHLRRRFEISMLAISRGGRRILSRLPRTRFEAGDVIVFQGRRAALADTLAELRCLPLADRSLTLGHKRLRFLPVAILGLAMVAIVAHLAAPAVAFFAAAVAVVLLGLAPPKDAYSAVDWPVIVMLGCLIPVGESLKTTGASDLIGRALTALAGHLPGEQTIGLVLVVSMLVTLFLHHAAAVLVMGPIAAALAAGLGYLPDAFLMAVAFGASCDFLSPIGHQNNALVMTAGGYRFGDYWRLGLPLTVMVAVCGTWLIGIFWPLH